MVDIETVPAVGVPLTIAEKAKERVRLSPRRRKQSFEANDQVWAVFDRDEHEQFDTAVHLCESLGIKVARSNPCFELWLILHERDFDSMLDRHQIQKELAKLRPEYDKSGAKEVDFYELIQRVEVAEDRAAKQLTRREEEHSPFNNPSTTVGSLTGAIRAAAKKSR